MSVRFLQGPLPGGDQALELAFAHATLKRVSAGEIDETVRVYRATQPVVVFGRRDTRLPGFPQAVEAANEAGFIPVLRATGGRAVAYTGSALVVDHVRAEPEPALTQESRFNRFGQMFVDVFRDLGIDARIGAVPGEYCPGAHSVNARGVVKLVGTAQRLVGNAWLFSSLIVFGDDDRIKSVLAAVYRGLEQEFDVASVGSLSAEQPGLDIDTVERAVTDSLGIHRRSTPGSLDAATLDLAHVLVANHRV